MRHLGDITLEEFGRLIRKHQAGVRAFICSLGTSFDYVDDIAQESFLIAWKKRDSFDTSRDFGNWVRGIARNVVLRKRVKDEQGAHVMNMKLSEILAEQSEGDEERDPETTLELVKALDDCVAQLPPKTGALLRERYETNATASQLAERLGTTADAVRQAFVRLRRRLRECIQERVGEAVP
jgi:RNA polymerase sigma-70 factor (ECF subfamily)